MVRRKVKLSVSEAHQLAALLAAVARPTTLDQQQQVAWWVARLEAER
jgi:hypothetical protein